MANSDRSLLGFKGMVINLEPLCAYITLTLMDYGCFCGKNSAWPPSSNRTMDEFDARCLVHDWCYHEAEYQENGGWWCRPYYTSYQYYFGENNVAYCGKQHWLWGNSNTNNRCQEFLCQCDIKFANSMRQLIENPNGARNCPKRNPGCPKG